MVLRFKDLGCKLDLFSVGSDSVGVRGFEVWRPMIWVLSEVLSQNLFGGVRV